MVDSLLRGVRRVNVGRVLRRIEDSRLWGLVVRTIRRDRTAGALFTAGPGTIWLVVFLLAPLAIMMVYSFGQSRGLGEYLIGPQYFTLEQYRAIFIPDGTGIVGAIWITVAWVLDGAVPIELSLAATAPTPYVKLTLKSIWIGAVTTIVCVVFGYAMAYYVARMAPARWRNLMLVLVVLPWWTSFLARVYAIKILFSENSLFVEAIRAIPFVPGDLQLLYTRTAVVFGLVYIWIPLMIIPTYSSIEQLDESLLDAAYDLGASRWEAFRRVTIPLTMPGVLAGSTLIFILSAGAYVIPELLGGPSSQMIGNQIASAFGQGGNWPFGAALSFVFAVIITAILIRYYERIGGGLQ